MTTIDGVPEQPAGSGWDALLRGLAAILSYRGESVSLNELMAWSGDAFNLCHGSHWQGVSYLCIPTDTVKNVLDRFGFAYACLHNGYGVEKFNTLTPAQRTTETQGVLDRIYAEIDAGRPALVGGCMDHCGEWLVVTGHDRTRMALRHIGAAGTWQWTVVRGFAGNPVYARDKAGGVDGHWNGRFRGAIRPGFVGGWQNNPAFLVGERTETGGEKEQVAAALQRAVTLHAAPSHHIGWWGGVDYAFGAEAYERWAEALHELDYPADKGRALPEGAYDWYEMGNLDTQVDQVVRGRFAAAAFCEKAATVLPRAAPYLSEAAKHYRDEVRIAKAAFAPFIPPHDGRDAPRVAWLSDKRQREEGVRAIRRMLKEERAAVADIDRAGSCWPQRRVPATLGSDPGSTTGEVAMPSDERMQWFRDARFGMFIHWGLYSLLKRGEWVMHQDGIPLPEYEALTESFEPRPGFAREWAALARDAGTRYAVLTTKHHDGFCLFRSQATDYNAHARGPKRDLVAEYVSAFREAGIKVGLYYSLGDWHEPCYRAVAEGDASRAAELRAFLHGQVRELMTQYGTIDLLWYDGAWYDDKYLTAETLDAAGLNAMARELQPGILINERAGTTEDYVTCENECKPAPIGTDWEMCTCINDLWGYAEHDYNYKTVNQLIFMLVNCAAQGGNLLLNIGPQADGTVPTPQRERLAAVGRWLTTHAEAFYGCERLPRAMFGGGRVTRRDGRLFLHTFYWPGATMRATGLAGAIPGAQAGRTPLRARVLTTGQDVQARWEGDTVVLEGLPETPPDHADTVIELQVARADAPGTVNGTT